MCGGVDDKTEPAYKVLCWEDITLWIVHDPYGNGGRDSVAPGLPTPEEMQAEDIDTTMAGIESGNEDEDAELAVMDGEDVASWRRTVELFGLNPDHTDPLDKANWHKPPGCLKALSPVQLLALTKIFELQVRGEIHGAMVQFDTGLGKTYIGHAFAVMSFFLSEL